MVVADRTGDALGLGPVVVVLVHARHRTVGPGGLQGAVAVDAPAAPEQHRVGDGEDLRRRAVVLGEAHDLGGGEAGREPPQGLGVGAVPGVDRLVGVADDAQVEAVAAPGIEQRLLQGVDVLELVDEEVLEAPPLGPGELGVAEQIAATHP